MNIDIYYDLVCPYSFIGHDQFIKALKILGFEDISLHYIPYPLDMKQYGEKTTKDALVKKLGGREEVVARNLKSLTERGKLYGLTLDFDQTKMVDTEICLYKINTLKNPYELVSYLFQEYFANGFDFSHDSLVDAFKKFGYDYDDIDVAEEVVKNETVHSVPTFCVNGTLFSGSNDVDGYIEIVKDIIIGSDHA